MKFSSATKENLILCSSVNTLTMRRKTDQKVRVEPEVRAVWGRR